MSVQPNHPPAMKTPFAQTKLLDTRARAKMDLRMYKVTLQCVRTIMSVQEQWTQNTTAHANLMNIKPLLRANVKTVTEIRSKSLHAKIHQAGGNVIVKMAGKERILDHSVKRL